MAGDVVYIDRSRDTEIYRLAEQSSSETGISQRRVEASYHTGESRFPASNVVLKPEQLYSEIEDAAPLLAQNLLQRAAEALREAQNYDPIVQFVQFDTEVMKARALIGKSLTYRKIGIGFTAVVNALNWAIANRETGSPTRKQITVILEAIARISLSPYLHFDTAMPILDALEDSNLNIESPALVLATADFDD